MSILPRIQAVANYTSIEDLQQDVALVPIEPGVLPRQWPDTIAGAAIIVPPVAQEYPDRLLLTRKHAFGMLLGGLAFGIQP